MAILYGANGLPINATANQEAKTLDSNLASGAAAVQLVASAAAKTAGIVLTPTPYGYIRIATDNELFTDAFDTDDQTVKWNANVVAGGGTITVANSVLAIATGTTASNAAARSSRFTFEHRGFGYVRYGFGIQLENATIQTNTNRFWGKGTPNASFTAATPLANAQGFEIGTDGVLYASVYAGNTRIFAQALTVPTDGLYHAYMMEVRSDVVFWFIDSLAVPVASAQWKVPNAQLMPTRIHMINHTSGPASAPTLNVMGVGVSDTGTNRTATSDGVNPFIVQTVDPTNLAARISMRPMESLGQYRISVATGTLAAALAAAAQIFQFKWTDASKLAIITKIRARIMPLTPFTATTLTDHTSLDAYIVRSYASGGGGTALTLTGNNAKLRTSMATSLAAINVATTAALTAATTVDAQPFVQSLRKGNRVNPAAGTEEIIMPTTDGLIFDPDLSQGESPLILAQNEGFVIRNRTVWPAAGTAMAIIEVQWSEVTSF